MKREHQKQIFVSVAILFGFLFAIPNVAQQSQSPSPNSVTSPAKNTSPVTKTPTKQANPKSTNTTPANSPSPLPTQPNNSNQQNSPSQKNPNFWDNIKDNWIKTPNVVLSALLTIFGTFGFGFYQLQQNRKVQKELIEYKHKLDLRKQEDKATKKAEAELKQKDKLKQKVADYAEKYRQKIIIEMCNLSICNLRNVPSSLSLDGVYVELSVREEELLHYTNPSEIDSLAEGDPNKLLKKSQLYLTEKSTDAMSPVEALVKFSQITVLGDPGAGKTTMLRFLALKMAQRQNNRLPYLPLYVELGKFVQSETKDLLEFIAKEFDNLYGFPKAIDYLSEQLNEGKAALLCDGLDEVLGGESEEKAQDSYNLAVEEINRLKIRFSQAPIVVTCRKAGWRRGLTGFKTLEVLDFSWEQIQDFIHNWFKSNPDKENGLKQALAGNLRMQTLAANPLIVSLITIVYQQDLELPERRAKLYKRCLDVLLREWDSSRQIKRYSNCNTDRKLNFLKEIAWHFHVQGKRFFKKEELLKIIAKFSNTHDINHENNNVILKEITDHYGFLKEQAIGYYGFLHLTFQEYLTALATRNNIENRLLNIISLHRDPWYTEVILLLSQMMEDATPLVLGILGHSINTQILPEGKLAIKDDLFHSDLFLAARCLVGTPIIRLQGLRERIIAEVKNLLLNSPYELDWRNAANTLMEIGGQEIEDDLFTILEDPNQDKWKGQAIANSFGKWGNTQTAKRLLAIIKSDTELDISVLREIISNIVELKATFAAPDFLEMLKIEEKSNLWDCLAQALGTLGNQTIIPELREIFNNLEWRFLGAREEIFKSIIKLGDKKQVSEFLSRLSNSENETPNSIKEKIAKGMQELNSIDEFVEQIIELIKNESITWQIRFVLAESLEKAASSYMPVLIEMLEDSDIDIKVRTGIALTLAKRGFQEGISYLKDGINNQIVSPDLNLNNIIHVNYIWHEIAETLKILGDNSIVTTLINLFFQEVNSQKDPDTRRKNLRRLNQIVAMASEYKSEIKTNQITDQLYLMLDQSEWNNNQNDIIRMLSKMATRSVSPKLLDLLFKRHEYNVKQEVWGRMVYAISKQAEHREILEALLKLFPTTNSQEIDLTDEIYIAIHSLSLRLNLHITPDLHIEEVVV